MRAVLAADLGLVEHDVCGIAAIAPDDGDCLPHQPRAIGRRSARTTACRLARPVLLQSRPPSAGRVRVPALVPAPVQVRVSAPVPAPVRVSVLEPVRVPMPVPAQASAQARAH